MDAPKQYPNLLNTDPKHHSAPHQGWRHTRFAHAQGAFRCSAAGGLRKLQVVPGIDSKKTRCLTPIKPTPKISLLSWNTWVICIGICRRSVTLKSIPCRVPVGYQSAQVPLAPVTSTHLYTYIVTLVYITYVSSG